MWTLHGPSRLVLERIKKVIPSKNINRKIMVIDSTDKYSIDYSPEILENIYDWELVLNNGKGISDGANTALSLVETDFFMSIEDDLVLSREYWRKIPYLFNDSKVAVASGVRYASGPEFVRKLQQYVYAKYLGGVGLPSWLRFRQASSFTLGKTLDNTLWRTNVLRELGGFPHMDCNVGFDTILAYKIHQSGFKWIVDYSVESLHLRKGGMQQELDHQFWYASGLNEIWRKIKALGVPVPVKARGVLFRLFTSPFTGVFVALKMREPRIAVFHPLLRLYYAKGLLKNP